LPGTKELLDNIRVADEVVPVPGVSVPVPIVWPLKTTFTVPVGAAVDPDTVMAYGVGWLKKQQSPLEYTGAPLTPEEPVVPTTICTVAVAVV
jgi:hypothetical protein